MCQTCINQNEMMASDVRSMINDYRQDREDGNVRETVPERTHDLAMLLIEMEPALRPGYLAWLAAIGLERLTTLEENGVEINV